MYINLSTHKIAVFTGFCFAVVGLVYLTYNYRERVPSDFSSIESVVNKAIITSKSFYYSTKFWSFNTRLFASTILALNGTNGNGSGSPRLPARSIPVLLYHGIVSEPDRFSLTPETFADQMLALKKAGYSTITLEEFYEFMEGKRSVPDKSILITFDDGRTDSYEGADPVLRALGYHAVMFVATEDSLHEDTSFSSYYINKSRIMSMLQSGRWSIGSHAIQMNTIEGQIQIDEKGSKGNFLSNKRWLPDEERIETDEEYSKRVEKEVVESKKELEDVLGVKMYAISYPFSDYGQQTKNNPSSTTTIARFVEETYPLAFQQVGLVNNNANDFVANYTFSDPHHLRRVEVNTSWSGDYLVKFLNNAHDKPLPYYTDLSQDDGWGATWGVSYFSPGVLNITSDQETTGAFSFLDGTRGWSNYMYAASVRMQKGSHISLIARYFDKNNFVSCVFSDKEVRVEQRAHGTTTVLSRAKNSVNVPFTEASLGILVDGRFVRCYEGDRVATYSFAIDPALQFGGVGIQVWDERKNNAHVEVDYIEAVPIEQSLNLKQRMPSYELR